MGPERLPTGGLRGDVGKGFEVAGNAEAQLNETGVEGGRRRYEKL